MIKKLTTSLALMLSATAFSQVGIQTETPQASLDVVGKPANPASLDGIIAPRIEGAQLRAKTYTTAQTGAMVYVTIADTTPSGQTIDVTKEGYYYFNGTKWILAGASDMINIYNSNGVLTDDRVLNFNQKELLFEGDHQSSSFSDEGLVQTGITGRALIKVEAADVNANGETTRFTIQANEDEYVSLYANGETQGITIETENTTGPAFIEFRTTPGGPGNDQRMMITGEGNIGINTSTPTEKFDINGNTRLRVLPLNGATNSIFTTPGGSMSSTQNQTFTATRTLVADANGVLGYVTGTPVNIYNANGSLSNNRIVTMGDNTLRFTGNSNSILFSNTGTNSSITATGTGKGSIALTGGNSILDIYVDNNSVSQIASRGTGSTGLMLRTENTTPLSFQTTNLERMRITPIGNVGIGITTPTERFHLNGNARLQNLPLSGSGLIFTMPNGNASATQNQTFTATRTVVADANGVLGYVLGTGNIYTADGSLTANRTLTLSNRTMEFLGSGQKTSWTAAGAMRIEGLNTGTTGRPTLNLIAPDANGNGTTSSMFMLVNHESSALIATDGDVNQLVLATFGTTPGVDKPIIFQPALGNATVPRMILTGAGRLGVQINEPKATLHIRITNVNDLTPAIIEGCNVYADNAAATTAGVPVGGLYRKADGTLMVRY